MNILFITAHPYLPQMYGGLQTSTDTLCRQLARRGHSTAVLGALMPTGRLGFIGRQRLRLRKILRRPLVVRDRVCGYDVWRAWFPWDVVGAVVKQARPDIIIVLAVKPVQMALAALPTGVPVLMELQDVEFTQHGGDFAQLGKLPAIANSAFTAETYRQAYSLDPVVIHPFVDTEKHRTTTTRENVTFINPHAYKGLPIALELARRCPDIPFTFIETWPLKEHERKELAAAMASLPNVTLQQPQKDMKAVWGRCRILLAPSLWNEGFGKVATEAQLSGIPALASTRGGLPEAVGPGGVLLDPTGPIEAWVAALRRLWDDAAYYKTLSVAAQAHANRPEMQTDYQLDIWEKILATVAKRTA